MCRIVVLLYHTNCFEKINFLRHSRLNNKKSPVW